MLSFTVRALRLKAFQASPAVATQAARNFAAAAVPQPSEDQETPETSALQGLLGLTATEVQRVLEAMPTLSAVKPSELQERMQLLNSVLGLSSARARSLVVEKPALLGDISVRDMRSMAGLSE